MARTPAPKLDLAAIAHKQQAEKDFKYFNVKRFILHPGQWTNFNPHGLVLNWNRTQFNSQNAAQVPDDQQGVYSFVVQPGIADHPSIMYLVYVGMTDRQDFRTRYRQYLKEPQHPKRRDHIAEMIEKWPDHLWFYYASVPTGTNVVKLEDELLAACGHQASHHILWDPFQDKMLSANRGLAETHLLVSIGEEPRSKDAAERYFELIDKRKSGELENKPKSKSGKKKSIARN